VIWLGYFLFVVLQVAAAGCCVWVLFKAGRDRREYRK
jgi:hypothetical protein